MIKRKHILHGAIAPEKAIAFRIKEIETLAEEIKSVVSEYRKSANNYVSWVTVDELELVVARLEETKDFLK